MTDRALDPGCPVCMADGALWCLGTDHRYGLEGTWAVYRCRDCGHGFRQPIPSEDELASYYPDSYYSFRPPATDLRPRGLRHRGLWLKSQYLKRRANFDHLHVAGAWLPAILGRPLVRRKPLSFGTPPAALRGRRVLDYGTGSGAHVAYLRHLGFDAEGIELSSGAAEAGRSVGLPITAGSVECLETRAGRYAYLMSSHCVEHVPDIGRLLSGFHAALEPGGILAIDVPNGGSVAAHEYGEHYFHLTLPLHVHYFTPASLEQAASKAGFTDIETATYSRWSWHTASAALRRGDAVDDLLGTYRSGPARLRAAATALRTYGRSRRPGAGDCLVLLARKPVTPGSQHETQTRE